MAKPNTVEPERLVPRHAPASPIPRVSTVPPDESKSDRFKRLANRRLRQAIVAIRSLGRLNARDYERTEAQINKIEETLDGEVEMMLVKLRQGHESEITDILG